MPASPTRTGSPATFPDLDLLDQTIPSAEELTEAALAVEDAARAVPGVTNSGGGSAGWSLGGLVLATSDGFAGSYLVSRFGLSASAIAGTGTGMERDYEFEMQIHHADLADPAIDRPQAPASAPSAASTRSRWRPAAAPSSTIRALSTGLVGSLAGAVNGASIARKTSFLRDKLGKQIFARRHHRSPTTRTGRAASLRVRSTARASPRRRSTSSPTACSRPGSSIRRHRPRTRPRHQRPRRPRRRQPVARRRPT